MLMRHSNASSLQARLNKALIGKALPRTLLLILLLLLLPPPTSPLLEPSIYHRLNRLSATTITTPTTPYSTFTTTTTTLHATPPTNTSRPSLRSRPPNPALGLNPTLNPYQLGRRLRRSVRLPPITLPGLPSPSSPPSLARSLTANIDSAPPSSLPSVLVVGSTGSLGLSIVRRLNLSSSYSVRVFVRDIFSATVEKLGASAEYAYGDAVTGRGVEVAVTDVDKVVYVAAAPNHVPLRCVTL